MMKQTLKSQRIPPHCRDGRAPANRAQQGSAGSQTVAVARTWRHHCNRHGLGSVEALAFGGMYGILAHLQAYAKNSHFGSKSCIWYLQSWDYRKCTAVGLNGA